MDSEFFVQNIKKYCAAIGKPPTVACKEAGVGVSFINDIKRGQTPSVAKVQMLADYLGVTTSELLGENTKPATVADDGPDPELWELLKRIPEERMPEVERYLRFQAEQKKENP